MGQVHSWPARFTVSGKNVGMQAIAQGHERYTLSGFLGMSGCNSNTETPEEAQNY